MESGIAMATAGKNKDYYEGEMEDYKPHGDGTMTFANGDNFVGSWIDGSMHIGRMTYADGSYYEGEWKDNKPSGRGLKRIRRDNKCDAFNPEPVPSVNIKLEETDDEGDMNDAEDDERKKTKAEDILKPWALILSKYCTYEEVRNCLAVNKSFWENLPPLIERLYIFKASELHIGYASRFTTLKHAYIYSLTSLISAGEDEDSEYETENPEMAFCIDTARKIVPFLQSFHGKLEFAYVGGYTPEYQRTQRIISVSGDRAHADLPYTYVNCSTDGHQEAFRSMVDSFCDAFARGTLDVNTLQLYGVLHENTEYRSHLQLECGLQNFKSGNDTDTCLLCGRICQTFPLRVVADCTMCRCNICLSEEVRLKIVYQRDNSFLRESGKLVNELIGECGSVRVILPPKQTSNMILLRETCRMAIQVSGSTFKKIDFLCKTCGCDTSVEAMTAFAKWKIQQLGFGQALPFEDNRNYISRELFDRIVKLGFRLRESDFIIIIPDQTNFPTTNMLLGANSDSKSNYWILDLCEMRKWSDSSTEYLVKPEVDEMFDVVE